jgi:hypothetical protein
MSCPSKNGFHSLVHGKEINKHLHEYSAPFTRVKKFTEIRPDRFFKIQHCLSKILSDNQIPPVHEIFKPCYSHGTDHDPSTRKRQLHSACAALPRIYLVFSSGAYNLRSHKNTVRTSATPYVAGLNSLPVYCMSLEDQRKKKITALLTSSNACNAVARQYHQGFKRT